MLRTTSILHTYLDMHFAATAACFQCVRWRRKPRWLPVAKSKLFRVPERTIVPYEEQVELMRLHNNYRTQVRAIRNYLYEELSKTASTGKVAINEAKLVEEEHVRCMQENAEWNANAAHLREIRLAKAAEAQKEQILNRIVVREQIEKEKLEEIEELVRQEKLKSQFYITADNIDKAIEEALANPIDLNFAIDLEGNIYNGRYTKPDIVPKEVRAKIKTTVSQ